jgi:hypothetical protein
MSTITQAGIISFKFNFADSNIITGSFAYDDSTGQPLTSNQTLTAFSLTDLFVEFEDPNFPNFGKQTWDETGWQASDVPPAGGVIVDQTGNVALSGSASNVLGNTIVFDFSGSGNPFVISSAFAIDSLGVTRNYDASRIPAPGGFALVMLGIFCLSVNRRYSESRSCNRAF